MDDLAINASITIPAAELTWTAARSGGPGGQNVNKVNSKIDLRFDLPSTTALSDFVKRRLTALASGRLDAEGRIIIVSSTFRSQSGNLDDARERLRELVIEALKVPKRRKKTKPSRGAQRRRLEAKSQNSQKKKLRGRVDRE